MITVNVSGNITADAIVRNVNGTEVVNFTVASNRRYKTASGEIREQTTFVNCSIWNKPATKELFYKGRAVNAVGFFNLRTYVDKDGQLKTALNLQVVSFQVFGRKQVNTPAPVGANVTETQPDIIHSNRPLDYPETQQPSLDDIIEDLPF